MIINHTHRFVFVHVPKAAGTAVATALRPSCTYRDIEVGTGPVGIALQTTWGRHYGLVKHATAQRIREVMGEEDWGAYFTFGFVRNPFSRLVSIYHFLRSWDKLPEEEARVLAPFPTFEDFLASDVWETGFGPSGIYRPQTAWLAAPGDRRTAIVDFVGRQETLAEDLGRICERIGVTMPVDALPKANVTPAYAKEVRWSDAAIDRVLARYGSDFQLFGYPTRPMATA